MSINVVSIVFHCFSPINLCSRFFAFFFSRSPFWTTRRSADASVRPTTRAPPGETLMYSNSVEKREARKTDHRFALEAWFPHKDTSQ